jgi:hypothetical protein
VRPRSAATEAEWVSASDLAEQAYCPRAYWYRHHPPSESAARAAERAPGRSAGIAYHTRYLQGELRRETTGAYALWLAAAIGLGLVVLALWWAGLR